MAFNSRWRRLQSSKKYGKQFIKGFSRMLFGEVLITTKSK